MSDATLIRATPGPSRLSPQEEQARYWKMMFEEVEDLGIIMVPETHNPDRWIESFRRDHSHFFREDDDTDGLNDYRYPNPSRVLEPGDQFRVRVMGQKKTHVSPTTSWERMKFLRSLGAVFTGPQGLFLVWAEHPHFTPHGYVCTSFDEPDRLWVEFDDRHMRKLPYMGKSAGIGAVYMDLWPFDHALGHEQLFLLFEEVKRADAEATLSSEVAPST